MTYGDSAKGFEFEEGELLCENISFDVVEGERDLLGGMQLVRLVYRQVAKPLVRRPAPREKKQEYKINVSQLQCL